MSRILDARATAWLADWKPEADSRYTVWALGMLAHCGPRGSAAIYCSEKPCGGPGGYYSAEFGDHWRGITYGRAGVRLVTWDERDSNELVERVGAKTHWAAVGALLDRARLPDLEAALEVAGNAHKAYVEAKPDWLRSTRADWAKWNSSGRERDARMVVDAAEQLADDLDDAIWSAAEPTVSTEPTDFLELLAQMAGAS